MALHPTKPVPRLNNKKTFLLVLITSTSQVFANAQMEVITVQGEKESLTAKTTHSVSKTQTDILHLSQSVNILTNQDLKNQDIQTLSSALNNISSASGISPSETLTSGFKLRGFSAFIYYDQLPAYGQTSASSPESMVNVERIEVVKGPTSTLFGGGTGSGVGGMLNIVTKSPQFENMVHFGVRAGSFATVNPYFDINQMVNENIAFRVTASHQKADSHIDEVESKSWSINPSLAIHFSDSHNITLKTQFSDLQYREYPGVPVIGSSESASYAIADTTFPGAHDVPLSSVKNTLVSGHWNYDISKDTHINLSGRYFDSQTREYSSYPTADLSKVLGDINAVLGLGQPFDATKNSSYVISNGHVPTDIKQKNINANLTHNLDMGHTRHQFLVGVEFDQTDDDSSIFTDTYCNVFASASALLADPMNPNVMAQYISTVSEVTYLDLANPASSVSFGAEPKISCFGKRNNSYETFGLYVQDQITFQDKWHLDLGLRWTEIESKEITAGTKPSSPDTKLIGRAGITYEVSDEVSVFTGYGQGFQAPVSVQLADGSKPEPSESDSWELGIKWRTDSGVSGNLAYFNLNRSHVATADPNNPGFQVQVGEQESKGVELDFSWQLSSHWLLTGNWSHINAKVTQDNNLTHGDRLARTPKNSGRLSARYEFSQSLSGLSVQLGSSYRSKQQITLPNKYEVDAYTLFDAQLGYAWKENSIQLSIQNLTNKNYYQPYGFLGLSVVEPGKERVVFLNWESAL
jgi:iron complex outermembrane receptor protein